MTPPPEIIPIILAGGEGRRLWPLSRPHYPKPFLKFGRRPSLLQDTARRLSGLPPPVVIGNRRHAELLKHHLKDELLPPQQVFLEPEGRGTAPAVASAAHYFAGSGRDPLLLVMPCDHAIERPEALRAAIHCGAPLAAAGYLVAFGVDVRRAASGFGYIRRGGALTDGAEAVDRFVEKPARAAARGFLAEKGGWLWNSGIFLFSASACLAALQHHEPALHEASRQAVTRAGRRQNMVLLGETAFLSCPAASIDRALMEKDGRRAVVPVDMGWRDLGSWPALTACLLGF